MAKYQNSNELSHERRINAEIKQLKVDTNLISDGYHTFGELYEHRITNFIALCKLYESHRSESQWKTAVGRMNEVWRTTKHSDGSVWDGWFILGIHHEAGKQITYHLPMEKWDECDFATSLDKAPDWDGHTSADVLERLKSI